MILLLRIKNEIQTSDILTDSFLKFCHDFLSCFKAFTRKDAKGKGWVAREDGLKLQITSPGSGSPWKRESHPALVSRATHGEGDDRG